MLEYILKVSFCWLAFYTIYFLFLRKETFFRTNRAYLLLTVCLGALIPLFENWISIAPPETIVYYMPPMNMDLWASDLTITPAESQVNSIDWMRVFFAIYIAGVTISLLRFIYGLYSIYSLYSGGAQISLARALLIKTNEEHQPFSFFKLLFMSSKINLDDKDEAKIIIHEQAHIDGKHSLDVILLELITIVFWCSPLIYLFKKSTKDVHEFLADDRVLQTTSTESYGHLLLNHSQGGMQPRMANHFINSQLKQRIIMMTRDKSTRKNLIRYVMLLPVLLILVSLFAQQDQEVATSNASAVVMDKDVSNDISLEPKELLDELSLKINGQEDLNVQFEKINTTTLDTSKVYKMVDEMPRFPGCEGNKDDKDDKNKCAQQKMLEFIYSNVKYSTIARDAGVQGTTVVRFIVEHTGKIKDAEVVREIGGGCGAEALKVVEMMPDWIPGMQDGKKVDVQYNIPIRFKLNTENKVESKSVSPNIQNIPKMAEQMPRFPGCEEKEDKNGCAQQKLIEFIAKEVRYPNDAKLKRIQGMTVIQFVVDKTGEIVDPKIVSEIGGGCGQESLRVVKSMPDWIPGKENGENVAVQFSLPIKFTLPQSSIEHAFEMEGQSNDGKSDALPSQLTTISPRFPGCENTTGDKDQCANKKMYSFIYENMVYPKSVKEGSVKGEVRVRFSISKNGQVGDVEVSQGLNAEIDDEVLRVIKSMPNWNPGVASDEILKVSISVPIKIGLNANSSSNSANQKAYIDGHIAPEVRNKLKDAYNESYGNDVSHSDGFTKAQQDDYVLTFKAIEMTMKEYDKNASLKVGTGEGEDKSSEEWLRHLEQAFGELSALIDSKGNSSDEEFKKMIERVYQNKTRISYGQK